jgi:hyperpolarization activated cyclic nucleotide-gated potassium channel 1
MHDFESNTWVYNKGIIDSSTRDSYAVTIYWAFQTLTTVGYGDFGCYNNYEIAITCVWMFIGVAFYSVVVGSLTSMLVDVEVQEESLNSKLKALEEFSVTSGLEPQLKNNIKNFLQNNYYDLFLKVEIE